MSKSLDRRRDDRRLLDRLLDVPGLADAIPRVPAELLHRVIDHCGLEDCADLVALATPEQLGRVLDLDLWRGGASGADERFDGERFGVWLAVLQEAGEEIAARQLAAIDEDVVVAGIAEHVRVFDGAVHVPASAGATFEIGGYLVVSRRGGSCEAVVDTLTSLHTHDPDCFHRVMRACRRLSNDGYEIDGLHDLLVERQQAMFDLRAAREQRRERQGFVTAAQARAFLQASREGRRTLFHAHLRAMAVEPDTDGETAHLEAAPVLDGAIHPTDAVVEVLVDAGIVQPPRALLGAGHVEAVRLVQMQRVLRAVHDCDPAAYALRVQELGYLANALMAGCAIQGRPLTPDEASEAAAGACNLALDHRADVSDTFLVDHDLLGAFEDGWAMLHRQVCLRAAERLIDALKGLRCRDRQIQGGLDALRIDLARHCRNGEPWRAGDTLDAIAPLDLPAWAALVGLIAQCPVVHAAIPAVCGRRRGAISPTSFEFISERRQIATVHEFLDLLPAILSGT